MKIKNYHNRYCGFKAWKKQKCNDGFPKRQLNFIKGQLRIEQKAKKGEGLTLRLAIAKEVEVVKEGAVLTFPSETRLDSNGDDMMIPKGILEMKAHM